MPDDSKHGNPSNATTSKNGSVAGMSSVTERQQWSAAAYDDAAQRSVANTADFSRHAETVGSGYSARTDAVGASNPIAGSAQDTQRVAISPNTSKFSVPNAQETFGSSFGDSQSEQDAFKAGMDTGIDQLGQAGVARSSEFGTDISASAHVDTRDAFSESYDTGRTGFNQPAGGSGQGFSQPQAQQTIPAVAAQPIQQVPAAFSSRMEQQGSSSPFSGGADRSAAAQQNMMTSIAGISDTRDFGFMSQAEREAEPSVPKPTAYRAGKESPAGGAKYADAPEDVRNAARNVVAKGEDVRKASDEMVATHREASEFITKAEKRAQTVANFKSAAANAAVNSAVASIGDDSVSGTAVRSSARAAVAAGRSIKASRAVGKQVGARSFFSSSAETSKAAILALDDDGSLDGLDKVDEAARAGRYVRGKAKDFKCARAKAKGGSKSQLMSQAEKRAARTSGDVQRASFSNSMQRRSMSIAKAKAAAGEIADANEKANLISKLVSGLANAGKQALQSLAALVQGIGSFLSGLFGSIAAALGSSVFAVIAVVILLIILFIVALFCDPSQATVQGLNETETQVATFFREKGLDDVQIAAIMGNMYGESGMHAGSEEGGGTNANGIGLCQWTNGRHTNLVNYANSVGKSWTDVGVQLDFFWDHDKWQSNWWSGYHINTYDHSPESMSEDPPSGSYVEGSKRGFLAATDVKDAVRQFLYGWEVAGIPRLKVRYDAAERYLEALQNGGDADGDHGTNGGAPQIAGATARQQAIVNSAYATPTPGQGLCAAWVSNVFMNAGYGFYGGNACDMCRSWCHSSNRNELKVGMIIADVSHPGTGSAGLTYGHVGIYIGNNKVMSNEGPITVKSLDAFIRFYGAGTGCRWGWLGGIDLSQ